MSMCMKSVWSLFGSLLTSVLAAAVLVVPSAARAVVSFDHPAQELVHTTTLSVIEQLQSDPDLKTQTTRLLALVNARILPHFDFTMMSKRVLGKNWRKANAGQQVAFVEQFKALLLRTYSTALVSYSGQTVKFLPSRERRDKKRVMIRTAIEAAQTSPLSVDYALYVDEGEWKVYDVTIEGISLVVTYRSSFSADVRKNGIDGLITHLRAKNEEH